MFTTVILSNLSEVGVGIKKSDRHEESEHKRDLPISLQGLNSIVPDLHLQFGPPGVSTPIHGTVTVDGTHHRATGKTLTDSRAFNS
jgi:hypothetical protein